MVTLYVDANSPNTPGAGSEADPYRSLSLAEAALDAVPRGDGNGTLSEPWEIICKSSGGSADTTSAVFSGITTSASNNINVYTHTDHRPGGKWDTTKYRIETAGARAISNALANITFTGIQAKTSVAGAYHVFYGATATTIFDRCIAAGSASTGNGFHLDSTAVVLRNCIAYGCNTGFHFLASSGAARNCTSVNNRVSGFARATSGTPTAKNCYAGGNATSDYTTNITLTTCASSDNTGTEGLRTIAVSTSAGAYFTNVSAGSEDFHIGASSSLKDVGTDLSAEGWTHDVDGTTRSGSWDIGADEYAAAAGATHYGAVLLSGVGGLAGAGRRIATTSTTLSGTGSLQAVPLRKATTSVSLSGVSDLAAAPLRKAIGGVALTGLGGLSATVGGVVVHYGAVLLSGVSDLVAVPLRKAIGGTALSAQGTLSAAALRKAIASATLSGVGTLRAVIPSTSTLANAAYHLRIWIGL